MKNTEIESMLFSPFQIGSKRSVNRFVSQAMEGNDGIDGGKPSERTLSRYSDLARGQWGVVIVEALAVDKLVLARRNGLILNDRNLDEFRKLVDCYKQINPDGLLLFQISHSGAKILSSDFTPRCGTPGEMKEGTVILSESELDAVKEQFIHAGTLAEKAGADGVDFKICHGYLGGELLRPSNTRNDRWGGSFENRTRFLREGAGAVMANRKSREFIVGSRISFYEGIRGGCGTASPEDIIEDLSEMKQIINLMVDLELEYINVSAGVPGVTSSITRPVKTSFELSFHQFRYAKLAKEWAELRSAEKGSGTPSIIGSAYSFWKEAAFSYGAENIRKGFTDAVGFGRQSFADPLTPVKFRNGEAINFCTACSGCSRLMIQQKNDGCIMFNDYYRELIKGKR